MSIKTGEFYEKYTQYVQEILNNVMSLLFQLNYVNRGDDW